MYIPCFVAKLTPWRGVALYLAFGVAWVFAGDALLAQWAGTPEQIAHFQTWKGWAYVLFTSALAGWLLARMRKVERQRSAVARELAQIVHHAPVGMARVALDGHILWANGCLCRMLGMELAELQAQNIRKIVQADDPEQATQQLARLLAGEIDHYLGPRHYTRPSDGHVVHMLNTVTYVPEEGDEPAHLDCVLQEMGEIQAARTALERSETRLRLAVEGSGSGMWDHDLVRDQTVYSPTVARMLHYTGDDFSRDFRMRERLHPDDSERVRLALQYALTSGEPFVEKLRLQCFDGNYRWFMARGVRHLSDAGQPERFSGILTDLTRERQIDERQRLAATVMENMSEGVIVTDTDNRILSVNASVTRLLGYTEEELLGKTPRVFKSERHDRAFYQAMWDSVKRTGRWQGEIWNRRKNGEVFPEHMSLSVARDAAGAPTHYVCMFSDISGEKAQHQRLEFLANNDALTGLSNRLWFCEQLEDAVVQARGSGERMAVLQLNLDRFKDVNDSYGHAIGDLMLKDIARRVQAAMRPGDLLGRMAGDELAVVARNLRHADGAAALARQLIAAVAEPWNSPEGFEVMAGVSVGICMFPEHATTAPTLLQGAHAAVYGAKALGRGSSCFYTENMTQAARERLALESRLRLALAQGHMVLHYQPQIDIASGRIVGAEALVRWNDPEEGLIAPGRFIPVAEVSGIIGPLGEWIIGEACRQGQRWHDEGLPPLTIAVNVSPRQFQLTDLVGCIASALKETGYSAALLELEITESALAEREDEALLTMRRLRDLGLRLAVDDFGTGYSSLAQLKRFPIDVLKIDQGFVRDIPQSSDDMAISAAIIAMGHSMDLRVLAEGVETAEQLAFLRERGCDSYQGYFCSRPVPAEALAALVRAQQAG